ncbi:MAG: hypothetical protein KA100_03440 [Rickettsiales bacterium]|nr:hypothetical protein [Rickettsiales bacterium]
MLIDAKFLTLLAFIAINFLILFTIKTRTTIVTSLIISHLAAVLFFSISISNYNSFKEIVLALIIFSMVILFLVSNYNPIYLAAPETSKTKRSRLWIFFIPAVCVIVVTVFVALFSIAKSLPQISKIITDEQTTKQNEILQNPMLLPSHPVHIAVKKFYLGKKFEDGWSDKTYVELEMNDRKRARLKDKLSDNFLLKRSSDVILIIVAISTSLLLLGTKKTENQA